MSRLARVGLAAAITLALAPLRLAQADAIDGHWCREGRHLEIAGPQITTPGRNRTQGEYSRHAFKYQVPANEPGGGATVWMVLLSEEEMQLAIGRQPHEQGAPVETWRRCPAPTS